MKTLIAIFALSVSVAHAADSCKDISGTWQGSCIGTGGPGPEEANYQISMNGCESITFGGTTEFRFGEPVSRSINTGSAEYDTTDTFYINEEGNVHYTRAGDYTHATGTSPFTAEGEFLISDDGNTLYENSFWDFANFHPSDASYNCILTRIN